MARLQSTKKVVTGVNNTTLAYTSNLAAGSLLCVTHAHYSASDRAITTPTDTLTHTYVPMAAQQAGPVTATAKLRGFYVANCSAGADTVTFDIDQAEAGDLTAVIAEYSGMATVSPLDQTAIGSSSSGTAVATAATGTTAQANEVCWGAMTQGGATTTIDETVGGTNGYALVQEDENGSSNMPLAVEDKTVSSAATYTASWTLGAAREWWCFVATFKAAAGGAAFLARVNPPSRQAVKRAAYW